MKRLFTIINLIFPILVVGQNPNDSLFVIYKSDNLVEIVKPLDPEINKIYRKSFVLDGVYVNDKAYGKLKNGEIKIYNRFYQLIEKYIFRDSSLILIEEFQNEKKINQTQFILKDSIYTCYFDNGNIKSQQHFTPLKKIFTDWYENGIMESRCEQIGDEQKCDNWDNEGYYKNGILRYFKDREVITEFELDASGKRVKQTK